jgi:hypothetical protein
LKTGKLLIISLLLFGRLSAQCPGAVGDQVTYGSNDTWIGYVYDNNDFTNYFGYYNEGAPGNMNFDQRFGNIDVTNFGTYGCNVQTETFSVRYKLNKNFADNDYTITVGGDDGYRFSLDGGATWVLQDWGAHGYTTRQQTFHLSGSTNLVIEYYENGGAQEVSFSILANCGGIDDPTIYGTNDVWRGYVYDNADLTSYKGTVFEGSAGNPFFDEGFGGDDVTYNTNACSVFTQSFSVRYRLRKTFPYSTVTFLVGGDDGYRFSLDGGNTWVVNNYVDHVYQLSSYTTTLSGTYNMVIEYYENNGQNRVSFDLNSVLLPIQLLQFSGSLQKEQTQLSWVTSSESNTDHFVIEKSSDGRRFESIGQVNAAAGISNSSGIRYTFADATPLTGTQYYRLRLVDKYGTNNYSEIITIKNNSTGNARIYPTILQPNTSLWLQTGKQLWNVTITVTDITGRMIMQQHASTLTGNQTTSYTLPWLHMIKGTYVVQVKDATGVQLVQKVIVR